VPAAEPGDDQAVKTAGGGAQQFTVVTEGEDDQADAHMPGLVCHGHREPSCGPGEQPHLALNDPADRPRRW
jgi:hypothetical protein